MSEVDILEAFRLADLQTAVTLNTHLKAHGQDIEFVKKYIKDCSVKGKLRTRLPRTPLTPGQIAVQQSYELNYLKPCPNCDTPMRLSVGDSHDNCQWTCPKCRHGEYVSHAPQRELKVLRKLKEEMEQNDANL